MAHIKKSDGRWIVDYRVAGIRKRPSFKNRVEAEAFKRTLLLRPIDRMTDFHEINEVTLTTAITQYLAQVTPTKSPRTADVDNRALKSLDNYFPRKLVNEITLMDLEAYQLKKRRDFSAASVNRHFNVIKHFFRKCEDWNFIRSVPTRRLSNLKTESNPRRLWTKEDVVLFFQSSPEWLKDIVFFIYETGVRRGEAVNLLWKDVDLSRNAIRINSIKGGTSRDRSIPMTVSMHQWFLEMKNKKPFLSKPTNHVFLSEEGAPFNPTHVSTAVHRVVHRMGCDGLGLHGMRHTILTELAQSDVSLEKVRRLAGHSNLKTTEKYLHLKIEDTRSMLETLNVRRDGVRRVLGIVGTSGQ